MKTAKLKLILLILLNSFILQAQKPSSIINPDSMNTLLIESLIKNKIDSVRKVNHKKALIQNDTLKMAATDQANYMKKIKKMTHFQDNNAKKKTPADRLAFYGLKNIAVAENVAFTFVLTNLTSKTGKEYLNNTYMQTANDFVSIWVKSPDHFNNITDATYTLTAIAVSFDKSINEIYAVQLFSAKK